MDQGLKPESIRDKVFGGIETRHTGKTHRKGKKNFSSIEGRFDAQRQTVVLRAHTHLGRADTGQRDVLKIQNALGGLDHQ